MTSTIGPLFKTVVSIMLLVSAGHLGVGAQTADTKEQRMILSNQEYWAKRGIGLISGQMYIVLNTKQNELLLGDHHKPWKGASADRRQVVFVWKDRVVDSRALPPDFTLDKATIVSFEPDRVYFMVFPQGHGGFYVRSPE